MISFDVSIKLPSWFYILKLQPGSIIDLVILIIFKNKFYEIRKTVTREDHKISD